MLKPLKQILFKITIQLEPIIEQGPHFLNICLHWKLDRGFTFSVDSIWICPPAVEHNKPFKWAGWSICGNQYYGGLYMERKRAQGKRREHAWANNACEWVLLPQFSYTDCFDWFWKLRDIWQIGESMMGMGASTNYSCFGSKTLSPIEAQRKYSNSSYRQPTNR